MKRSTLIGTTLLILLLISSFFYFALYLDESKLLLGISLKELVFSRRVTYIQKLVENESSKDDLKNINNSEELQLFTQNSNLSSLSINLTTDFSDATSTSSTSTSSTSTSSTSTSSTSTPSTPTSSTSTSSTSTPSTPTSSISTSSTSTSSTSTSSTSTSSTSTSSISTSSTSTSSTKTAELLRTTATSTRINSNDITTSQNNEASILPTPSSFQSQLSQGLLEASKQMYTIIIWEPPFQAKSNTQLNKENCGWCEVVYDQSKVNENYTKAVVFHFNELRRNKMPTQRRPDQMYVWWTMESPTALSELRNLKLSEYDNLFNMTMSYRRDSDLYTPYGYAPNLLSAHQWNTVDTDKAKNDLMLMKTNLSIWIVSNCGATAAARNRLIYAESLVKAGLKLVRKGRCFPRNNNADYKEILHYKFYMAFENSYHCKDYITEKFFRNAFHFDSVPVVYGATKFDYEAVAPPGSFIYAEDYKTPKQLVDYLNYLDNNNTAYLEYFKWRTMKVEDMSDYGRQASFCQLCRVLHGINVDNIYNEKSEELASYIPMFGYPNRSRVIPSLRDWFYGSENRECLPKY